MDERIRLLERAAQSGTVEDRAALLVARLRTAPGCERCDGLGRVWVHLRTAAEGTEACRPCAGTGSPLRARVELAGWCGSEAAWDVGACRGVGLFFPEWLNGLSRWADVGPAPGWILVRAAVAAARVAYPVWCGQESLRTLGGVMRPGESPDAFVERAWFERVDPPLRAIEAAEAWLEYPCEERTRAWHDAVVGPDGQPLAPVWVPYPTRPMPIGRGCSLDAEARIAQAAGVAGAGEQPVRDAISRSLISWALSQEESRHQ